MKERRPISGCGFHAVPFTAERRVGRQMKPKKRSFVLSGLLIVLVGIALASGGLQIPGLLKVLAIAGPQASGAGVTALRAPESFAPEVPAPDEQAGPLVRSAYTVYSKGDYYTYGQPVPLQGRGWEP